MLVIRVEVNESQFRYPNLYGASFNEHLYITKIKNEIMHNKNKGLAIETP